MKKCYLENRRSNMYKPATSTTKTLAHKATKSVKKKNVTRSINVPRVNPEEVHAKRVAFNEQHFGCTTYYRQNGKKTWITPVSKKETPAITVKRILQILVPSNFRTVTDKTRKKLICKRDVKHHVISSEETEVNIVAHGENAAKEMLLKAGINKDSIMTSRNVCYVTLHKQVSEEKIRELFPTLHMQIFKVRNKA